MEKITKIKVPNYTEAQETRMREFYLEVPCRASVNLLAEEFGKRPRSVIAKLSKMGIYVTPPRTTKQGTPIVKKEVLVAQICEAFGIEAPSLIKANKLDLERLNKFAIGVVK